MKKKKIRYKKDVKNRTGLMLFLLFTCFTLCLSVGYAALNSDLKISGEANFRVVKDIRITDVSLYETTNLGLENYTSKYSKDTITIGSDLKQVNSTISYKVKVQNSGTVVMWIDSIEETKNNDNIEYVLEGIGIKELINPGEEKEFTLKIKYKDGITVLPDNTNIDTILKFNFIKPESTLAMGEKVESTEPFFNGKIAREKIESIEFRPTLDVVDNAVGSWDASLDRNGTVIASYIDSDKNGLYELYIGGIGVVNAPRDSTGLFSVFSNLIKLNFNKYFNTSYITNMSFMLAHCTKLEDIDLSNFDTSNVTNMNGMFKNSGFVNLDLDSFDTSKVTIMKQMFYYCEKLEVLNLKKFNTSRVTNMFEMFRNTKITNLNLLNFDTSNVTEMQAMFQNCNGLISLNISSFNTSKVTNMSYMFNGCKSLSNLDLTSFDTSNVINMQCMFRECISITKIDVSNFNTSNVKNMFGMFSFCSSLESLNVSNFNTSKVGTFTISSYGYGMFYGCKKLETLDVSNFDLSSTTDIHGLFSECSNIKTINMTGWNTSNIKDMNSLFWACKSLTELDVSNFDTRNVTNMDGMFFDCELLKILNLSAFDTPKVTNMNRMFQNCYNLKNIDLSNFDTRNVTNMASMFQNCYYLKNMDLSHFDTSNVTNMAGMFRNCYGLMDLNISSFDFSKVTNSSYMFLNVPTSSLIYVKDNASKEFILGVRNDLSNVQIKNV